MNGNHFNIHDLKREYEKGRKQGAVEATQSCYFTERQFLLKIAELEKKDYEVLQRLLKQRIERLGELK